MRRHSAEYYGLLAAAAAGMIFFLQANNLMTLFLGLEWFSISLYILCAIDVSVAGLARGRAQVPDRRRLRLGRAPLRVGARLRRDRRARLRGASPTATAAQGLSDDLFLVTGLAMIIAGLAFKASAAPFHMWTPDVYEGAPTPVTSFMAAATKAAALVVTLRLLTTAFGDEARAVDDRARRHRLRVACGRQPRGDRPDEHQAAARLLVDRAGRLHADPDRRRERDGRQGAPLLPHALRRGLARRVRRRRRTRARARPARHAGDDRRHGLGAAAARRRHVGVHALVRRPAVHRRLRRRSSTRSPPHTTAAGPGS